MMYMYETTINSFGGFSVGDKVVVNTKYGKNIVTDIYSGDGNYSLVYKKLKNRNLDFLYITKIYEENDGNVTFVLDVDEETGHGDYFSLEDLKHYKENIMKYKVGDKVIIEETLNIHAWYDAENSNRLSFLDGVPLVIGMLEFAGKIATITNVIEKEGCYKIDIDNGLCSWSIGMFNESEIRHSYKVGDKVVPHAKTISGYGDLGDSTNYKNMIRSGQEFLYVTEIRKDMLVLGYKDKDGGDFFNFDDVTLYVEPVKEEEDDFGFEDIDLEDNSVTLPKEVCDELDDMLEFSSMLYVLQFKSGANIARDFLYGNKAHIKENFNEDNFLLLAKASKYGYKPEKKTLNPIELLQQEYSANVDGNPDYAKGVITALNAVGQIIEGIND